jgi:hypothetical protein
MLRLDHPVKGGVTARAIVMSLRSDQIPTARIVVKTHQNVSWLSPRGPARPNEFLPAILGWFRLPVYPVRAGGS